MNKELKVWLLMLLFCAPFQVISQLPNGFQWKKIADNLDPTAMSIAPDGGIWLTEKEGRVRIVRNDLLLEDPFLILDVDNINERGLGGIALDPDFDNNYFVYLYYTVENKNHNRVSRFTAGGDLAVPGSEKVLIDLDNLPGQIHNGGSMVFDNNNYLFIGTGDGSHFPNAQRLDLTLGKILRIRADGTIPDDNPFTSQLSGKLKSIWSYGLRNPFTMSIQPESQKLFVNDVGGTLWEEINIIEPGLNYGWPEIEGNVIPGTQLPDSYRDPFYAYPHSVGCSIIGSAFCPTNSWPEKYHNKYFYGDYCNGTIRYMDPKTGQVLGIFARGLKRLVSFAFDDDVLYILERRGPQNGPPEANTISNDGKLWKVTYSGTGFPYIAEQPKDITITIGESAKFSCIGFGDNPIHYQWFINENPVSGNDSAILIINSLSTDFDGSQIYCEVSNSLGTSTSWVATLTITSNNRPIPKIISPSVDLLYSGGDNIEIWGTAHDLEDGMLNSDHLKWRVDFHHNKHTHPILSNLIFESPYLLNIPSVGELDPNVWIRIYLTAKDSEGLSKTVYQDLLPSYSEFSVETSHSNIAYNLDGKNFTGSETKKSVTGMKHVILSKPSQIIDDLLYRYQGVESQFEINDSLLVVFPAHESHKKLIVKYEYIPWGRGSGLTGDYVKGKTESYKYGRFTTRIDPIIDFDWGLSRPGPKVPLDNFSVRWKGDIEALFTENVSFHVLSDDGVKLWINDKLLIDNWNYQAAKEVTGEVFLEAGKRYPIELEYFEGQGASLVKLQWSSKLLEKTVVPSTQLYPTSIFNGESVAIHPNPLSSNSIIQYISEYTQNIEIQVFNLRGQLILKQIKNAIKGQNFYKFETDFWSSGVYFFKLISNDSPGIVIKALKL